MILTRNGSQPSVKGPDDWFTGDVRIDPIAPEAREPSRLTSAIVTFEPGLDQARSRAPTNMYCQLDRGNPPDPAVERVERRWEGVGEQRKHHGVGIGPV